MNDFTKDELNEIKSALSVFAGSPRGNKLYNKIQSLIDNYCEQHEADEFENLDICKYCDKRFR